MNDRDETIKLIKTALKRRSGKPWSVTGGRGTAWGWITIDAQPKFHKDETKLKQLHHELGQLLGKDIHHQGEHVPASSDYYREYVDRAEGRTPSKIAKPYWD